MSSTDADSLALFRQKVLVMVTIVAIVALVLFMFVSASGVLPLIFIAILIAIMLRSLADPLSHRLPLAGRWAVVIVALGSLVAVGLFGLLVGPQISNQFDQLTERIPEALDQAEAELQKYGWGQTVLDGLTRVPNGTGNMDILTRLTGFFSSTLGTLANLVLVTVAGVYLAFEPDLYINNLIRLFPQHHRERTHDVLAEGYGIIRLWLIARLLSMIVVGVLTLIGLWIIDMPLALTLAVIAGFLSFIPNLGPFLSVVPAILVGLTQSLLLAVLAIAVYWIVQQIENYLITPNIQRETVKLPPALVMLSQIFLLLTFGWLGLVIAAPLVAFAIVVVKSVYIEDFLGDERGRVAERDH